MLLMSYDTTSMLAMASSMLVVVAIASRQLVVVENLRADFQAESTEKYFGRGKVARS